MTKTFKPKNCPICKLDFTPQRPIQKVCSPKCAYEHSKQLLAKKEAKEIGQRIEAIKKDLIGIPELKNRLEHYINKIVRLIDKGHHCISSNASYGTYTVHAGHFYSVGSNGSIRFNLLNIYAQSNADNIYKSGNQTQYRLNLVKLFGSDLVNEIEGLGAKYPLFKPTKIEMIGYIQKARGIALKLESDNKIYSTVERIELRKEFNGLIGIYL